MREPKHHLYIKRLRGPWAEGYDGAAHDVAECLCGWAPKVNRDLESDTRSVLRHAAIMNNRGR